MRRTSVSQGRPIETRIGWCRAVRVGPQVFVSGCVGTNQAGEVPEDLGEEARLLLGNLAGFLAELGAEARDVVQTRAYLTDLDLAEPLERAHRAMFGAAPPASTWVQVDRLINRRLHYEVEAQAVIASDESGGP